MATTIEQRLSQATEEKWAYSMFLETLLTDEIERRDNKHIPKETGQKPVGFEQDIGNV